MQNTKLQNQDQQQCSHLSFISEYFLLRRIIPCWSSEEVIQIHIVADVEFTQVETRSVLSSMSSGDYDLFIVLSSSGNTELLYRIIIVKHHLLRPNYGSAYWNHWLALWCSWHCSKILYYIYGNKSNQIMLQKMEPCILY